MKNQEFIKTYGIEEYKSVCDYVPLKLALLKEQKKIGWYKLNNKRKRVKIYNNGIEHTFDYIEVMGKEFMK